ncbi:MAG: hypothetical protein ACREF7_01885, partial [Candidatus Saccharimonadales bacterium]
MSRKILISLLLGLTFICFGFVFSNHIVLALPLWPQQAPAYPCGSGDFGVTGCQGYFTGVRAHIYNCGYPCINAIDVLAPGIYANSTSRFITVLTSDLSGTSGGRNQEGAAFIIDAMLGHGNFAGFGGGQASINAGIAYAQQRLAQWEQSVNYVNSLGSGYPSYGINWNYNEDCTNNNDNSLNSAYFGAPSPSPDDIYDDAFHDWICTGPDAGIDDGPAIVFSWSGGSFIIGQDCGNLEGALNALPVVPPANPSGNIHVVCEATNPDDYSVTVTFSDPYYPTTGTISTAGWNSNQPYSVRSGSTTTVTVNDPFTSQPVYLKVADDGGTYTYTADTSSCVAFSCNLTVTPSVFDPYTPFNIQASVTNSVNKSPPGAMNMRLSITPQNGGSYGYSGSQVIGSTNSVTFSSLGPTNSPGEYLATGTLSGSYTANCTTTFSVSYLPYLQIYGGDVMTGASPTSASGQCLPSQPAGIFSWNN